MKLRSEKDETIISIYKICTTVAQSAFSLLLIKF